MGHIKTLDCSSVSDAADREGGLNHSINPHTLYTVLVSSVAIHSPTVQLLHKQIRHRQLYYMKEAMETDCKEIEVDRETERVE